MSVVAVLVVGVVLLLVLMLLAAGLTFLRRRAGGGGALVSTVLPSLLLLGAAEGGTSPTKAVGSISVAAVDLGKSLFLLDLLLSLGLDIALVTLGIVSVVGVEKGGVAQRNVLAAPAVGNLFSVEISTNTDSLVPVGLIDEDDDLLSIESDVVLGGQDLDSARWVGLDASDVIVAL